MVKNESEHLKSMLKCLEFLHMDKNAWALESDKPELTSVSEATARVALGKSLHPSDNTYFIDLSSVGDILSLLTM